MVTVETFIAMVAAMPDVAESRSFGNQSWKVGTRNFAWVRPLTSGEIKRWGDAPQPRGDTVALHTDGLDDKAAVLAAGHAGVLHFAHFAKHPAVLVDLGAVAVSVLSELIEDAWLACAPPAAAAAYLAQRGPLP